MKPHQAKRQQAFMAVRARVRGSRGGRKREVKAKAPWRRAGGTSCGIGPLRGVDCKACQASGSSTLRRIHNVTSAGRMPTKKTPRQPQIGMTRKATSAASA